MEIGLNSSSVTDNSLECCEKKDVLRCYGLKFASYAEIHVGAKLKGKSTKPMIATR